MLPNTMDFKLWGEIITSTKTTSIVKKSSDLFYFIKISKDKLNVELKSLNKTIIRFEDNKKDENFNTFIRIVWNENKEEKYFYVNGE